mmetsp:Transcript_27214/g.60247  ORF Transcript_27214/g.60247 Transcript_27214/m.60247 type:complete len:226 (+) Transcript_27214:109-786(+)
MTTEPSLPLLLPALPRGLVDVDSAHESLLVVHLADPQREAYQQEEHPQRYAHTSQRGGPLWTGVVVIVQSEKRLLVHDTRVLEPHQGYVGEAAVACAARVGFGGHDAPLLGGKGVREEGAGLHAQCELLPHCLPDSLPCHRVVVGVGALPLRPPHRARHKRVLQPAPDLVPIRVRRLHINGELCKALHGCEAHRDGEGHPVGVVGGSQVSVGIPGLHVFHEASGG